jgi:hypothetical protein
MTTTATEMANAEDVKPRTFRKWLRAEIFGWHIWKTPWRVEVGSAEHRDMLRVLREHK